MAFREGSEPAKRSHESLRWHWQREIREAAGESDSAKPGGRHGAKTITVIILLVLMILMACSHLETRELPAIGTADTDVICQELSNQGGQLDNDIEHVQLNKHYRSFICRCEKCMELFLTGAYVSHSARHP